jgi:diguanylate cyclase (GGDEF)-like protein
LPGGLVFACLLFTGILSTARAGVSNPAELLLKADQVRTANYPEFANILRTVQQARDSLTASQREYLRYLEAWQSAYEGDNDTAMARLNALADTATDVTLRLRAGATAVNVLQVSKRYEEAFSRLSAVLELLPQVSDKAALQQAQVNAAQLYTDVGQFALALSYAQTVIDENWQGRGVCIGSRLKERALYESGRYKTAGPDLQGAIETCVKVGENLNANAARVVAAQAFIDQKRLDEAIKVLQEHYDEVKASRAPWVLAMFDALLADAYRRKGAPALAREFALNVTGSTVKEPNDQLVIAYRVLYEIAKQQGDFKTALEFHEQYSSADKAYLDDLSARHLAYQKVNHENIANKLQVDALNKQNHVLQLERQLSSKAVEASRLYIVMLTMTVIFIGLWAYRTKRSQLHFQALSQLDGLTGICNRLHFISRAEKVLEASRRTGEQVCIVLCDLDHFKSINDRYGHATGDFVLKRTVSACNVLLTKSEIFGRFGGEEFGILLPACGPEQARERAEQLRMSIAGITAYQGTTKATVSASFGIATTSQSGHELGQLLAHADAALYEAKRAGRNRVVLYGQPNEHTSLAIVGTTGEFVQYTGRSSGG